MRKKVSGTENIRHLAFWKSIDVTLAAVAAAAAFNKSITENLTIIMKRTICNASQNRPEASNQIAGCLANFGACDVN